MTPSACQQQHQPWYSEERSDATPPSTLPRQRHGQHLLIPWIVPFGILGFTMLFILLVFLRIPSYFTFSLISFG